MGLISPTYMYRVCSHFDIEETNNVVSCLFREEWDKLYLKIEMLEGQNGNELIKLTF